MGLTLSKETPPEELASHLVGLNDAYAPYADLAIENQVDGAMLLTFSTKEEITELLSDMGVVNKMHVRAITTKILEAIEGAVEPPASVFSSSSLATGGKAKTPGGSGLSATAAAAGGGGGGARKAPTSGPTHCFLTHNWANGNHERVAAANGLLASWGVVTWFDDEQMTGQVRKKMAEGIENTQCVVVFITALYRDKVNGDDMRDNCQYEFTHAVQQLGPQRMIPVVMEASMRNPRDWKGQLGAELGSVLYIDMSDAKVGTAAFEAKVGEIYQRIDQIVGVGSSSRGPPPVLAVAGGGGGKGRG
jgi:hypothetical protein